MCPRVEAASEPRYLTAALFCGLATILLAIVGLVRDPNKKHIDGHIAKDVHKDRKALLLVFLFFGILLATPAPLMESGSCSLLDSFNLHPNWRSECWEKAKNTLTSPTSSFSACDGPPMEWKRKWDFEKDTDGK